MQITPSTLSYLFNQFDLRYQDAYRKAPEPWWNKIATEVPSTTEFNTYAWSDRVPQLREWIGERQARSLGAYSQQIINKPFELTIEVDRNKIEDDQLGAYSFSIDDIARAAKKHPDVLVLSALRTGQSIASFDGVNFFSATHPVSKYAGQSGTTATQSNYWSSSKPLTFDNYQDVRATMMGYLGADGLPLGVVPRLLVVPPQLEVTANLICNGDSVAPATLGGVTQVGANYNPLKGTAQVLVIPELAVDATTWYLIDPSRSVMPFIYQNRKSPEFVQMTDPKSANVFNRNKFVYGVDLRANAGTSLWFLAAKAVG